MSAMTVSDWSGVIQGIGSLAAVVVAVGVYVRQFWDKRNDDENETIAFVQAIRTEVSVVWDQYEDISRVLQATPTGGVFNAVFPYPENPLLIYSATPERVGKIEDENLRTRIVLTCTWLRSHFDCMRAHGARIELLSRDLGQNPENNHERAKRQMAHYTEELKALDSKLHEIIDAFMTNSKNWLDAHR